MTRFKSWLFEKFLPAYCRDGLLEENRRLAAQIAAQRQEIERQRAYIDGMEAALRSRQRVIIRNEVSK